MRASIQTPITGHAFRPVSIAHDGRAPPLNFSLRQCAGGIQGCPLRQFECRQHGGQLLPWRLLPGGRDANGEVRDDAGFDRPQHPLSVVTDGRKHWAEVVAAFGGHPGICAG